MPDTAWREHPWICSGRRWAGDVTAIASLCLAEQRAAEFDEPLPGLGIPSDFAVLADPVAVGDSAMPSHGGQLVVRLVTISARAGFAKQPFHSGQEMQLVGKSGTALAHSLIDALAATRPHGALK